MENSLCTDYISEKFWARLHLPLIPIVLRRSLYENEGRGHLSPDKRGITAAKLHVNTESTVRHAPRNSFIAIDDYKTPADLADYLTYLIGNRTAYMEYFAWRIEAPMRVWTAESVSTRFCHLCRALSTSDYRPRVPVIPSITEWFTTRTKCDDMKDVVEWSAIAEQQRVYL
ncbi:alpha1,3-fucosyltransferase [Aphelenchoides avenae]|nr:alpha1,3-fucosyltransferase [Aphelenchus avenae]